MKLALISGGSRGLGHAACEQLIGDGFEVIEFSRTAPHDYSVRCDFADPTSVGQTITETLLSLDLSDLETLWVINNAGVLTPIGPTAKFETAELIDNMSVNIASAVVFMSEVMRQIQNLPARKVIANISSGAATSPYAGWSLYCMAKAGIEQFVRSVAEEQKNSVTPVTLLNFIPGVIDTEMQREIRLNSKENFPEVQKFINRHQQGLLRSSKQVAASLILAMADQSLISGQTVSVDSYLTVDC
ncbi:MAG: SDR family NAD(P)-dependent oxidoreductase [Gammaproteobacteria bacterium]|nr:SDR family NAD(P)-dependent oxidoreductase [Gammaproteobacteria bacterium]